MRDVIYYIFPDVMTLSFYFLGNEKEKKHVEYIVACFLPGPTTLRPPQKPGPETHFFRAKLEGFYSAQTAQNSLESFTTMPAPQYKGFYSFSLLFYLQHTVVAHTR